MRGIVKVGKCIYKTQIRIETVLRKCVRKELKRLMNMILTVVVVVVVFFCNSWQCFCGITISFA